MPKTIPILKTIPEIYRYESLHTFMFWYVLGTTDCLNTISRKTAIMEFRKRLNLTEDDYPIDTAIVTFSRMLKSYSNDN